MTFSTFSKYNYLLDEDEEEEKPSQIAREEQKKKREWKTFPRLGREAETFVEPEKPPEPEPEPTFVEKAKEKITGVIRGVTDFFKPREVVSPIPEEEMLRPDELKVTQEMHKQLEDSYLRFPSIFPHPEFDLEPKEFGASAQLKPEVKDAVNKFWENPIDNSIQSTRDFLSYHPQALETLANAQRIVEETPYVGLKESPLTLGIAKGIASTFLGSSEEVRSTFEQRLIRPVESEGQVAETVGEVIGTVMSYIGGGAVLKGLGFARATLPVLFATLGQTSAPPETTIEQRIKKLPVDVAAGWIFSKVPVLRGMSGGELLKAGGKGIGISATALGGSGFLNALIEGKSKEEAAQIGAYQALIGALFYVAGSSIGLLSDEILASKVKTGKGVFTGDQIREIVRTSRLDGTKAGTYLLNFASQADKAGKNVQINMAAMQRSFVSKKLNLNKPETLGFFDTKLVDVAPRLPPEPPVEPKPPTKPKVPAVITEVGVKPLGKAITVFRGAKDHAIDVTRAGGITKGVSFSTSKDVAERFAKKAKGTVEEYEISEDAKVINHSELEKMPKEEVAKFLEENEVDVVRFDVPEEAKGEGELRVINDEVLVPAKEVEKPPILTSERQVEMLQSMKTGTDKFEFGEIFTQKGKPEANKIIVSGLDEQGNVLGNYIHKNALSPATFSPGELIPFKVTEESKEFVLSGFEVGVEKVTKVPKVAEIPTELEPLAVEARKYKSAEEFGKVVSNKIEVDIPINKIKYLDDIVEKTKPSFTKEPIRISYDKASDKFFVIDGEHRVADAFKKGETNVKAVVDFKEPAYPKFLTDFYTQATKEAKPPTKKPPVKKPPKVRRYKSFFEKTKKGWEWRIEKDGVQVASGIETKPLYGVGTIKETAEIKVKRLLDFYTEKPPKKPPKVPTKVKKVEKELADEVDKRIGEITPPIGLRVERVYKPPIEDKVEGLEFSDAEVESRYKLAKGIKTRGYYLQKSKEFIKNFHHRLTRTYPDLPNTPEFAELRNILTKQKSIKPVVQDRTARILQGITADIGPNKLDLLTRKVILDDLTQEAKVGRPLPFGYSEFNKEGELIIKHDLLSADKEKIDRLVFANPDVAEALTRRDKIWKAITDELVKHDILKEKQVKKDYFRHQILEYVNAKTRATKGTGPAMKKRKPAYARQRYGSTYDINTDYLEAEFEVMSQALHDIEIAKLLEEVEGLPINIKSKLLAEAKGKEDVSWRDLIPEGYTTWQPKDGRIFYSVYTVPERIVNEFVDGIGKGVLKLDQNLINKALAVGGRRKELVLPEGVVKTLDNLWIAKQPNWVRDSARKITTLWKKWVLFNPRRAIKYNYQNFLGDSDAVLAGNPAIFKKLPQSIRELYAVFAKNAPMTDHMQDFFERGGFSSMLTIQEIPDIKNIKIFERHYKNAQRGKTILQKVNIFSKYWGTTIKLTQFRESLLRYAGYLEYIERLGAGKKLKNYGASKRSEIDALKNPKDKAAKLATELLGDYANITALGKDLRESIIPFYSWNEINLKRYPIILRNAWQEGFGKGGTAQTRVMGLGVIKGLWALYKTLIRIISLTGTVMVYNQLFHGDAEQDLGTYDRGRMHINLGYDENGNVVILRGQGAFADALEWFGLDEAPILWREYFEGKASLTDIIGKVPFITGKIGLKPALSKVLRSISPTYKIPTEVISGFSWPFTDLKGYPITDRWRQIFRNVQLENEYDWIFQKPSRGYLKSWELAVITRTDPLENAYRYIQSEKYRYLASKGKGGSSTYYTPRSIVYRNYKKALAYKDKEAEDKAWEELQKLGVKSSDLKKSLEWADPLAGLNKKEKKEFVKEYLSQSDRVRLEKAETYYKKVFK